MAFIKTNDDQIIELSAFLSKHSELLKGIIDDLGENNADSPIPLPQVDSETLNLFNGIDFEIPDNERNSNEKTLAYFTSKLHSYDKEKLKHFIIASSYLLCKPITSNIGKYMATLINGKTREEILAFFD